MNRMSAPDSRLSLVSGAALAAVITTVLLGFCTVQFETNDDAAMNMYAGGFGLVSRPSQYLLFINAFFGLLLRALYQAAAGVPWYGYLIYLILFLASALISAAMFDAIQSAIRPAGVSAADPFRSRVIPWLICAAWLIIFTGQAIVAPQFTTIAAYSTGAGIVYLCRQILTGSLSRTGAALALLAIILGCLLRLHSVYLAGLVLAPLVAAAIFYGRRPARLTGRLLLLFLPVLIVLGLESFDRAYYRTDPRWNRFNESNELKGNFTDRPIEKNDQALAAAGWSENDLLMIKNFFFLDPEVYSDENLRKVSELSGFQYQHKSLGELGGQAVSLLKTGRFQGLLFGSLLFGAVTLGVFGSGRFNLFATTATLLFALSALGALAVLEKEPPFRVWYPVLGLVSIQYFIITELSSGKRRLGAAAAAAAALCFFSAWSLASLFSLSNSHRMQQSAANGDLQSIFNAPASDKNLYVVWGNSFPFESVVYPLQRAGLSISKIKLLALGVGNQQPHVQDRLKEFGITDLYRSIYSDSRVFMIVNSPDLIGMLKTYLGQHYKVDVSEELVFDGTTFKVYRFSGHQMPNQAAG